MTTRTKIPDRRTKSVRMLDLRPDRDLYDPAMDEHSRSPVIGVSYALISLLAGFSNADLAERGRDYRKAVEGGETPPAGSVNLDDWWDIFRWLLEHRATSRLTAEGVPLYSARRRAALEVAVMLAPIRELLR